jgi:hypothetical protein
MSAFESVVCAFIVVVNVINIKKAIGNKFFRTMIYQFLILKNISRS